jgi:lipoate-protein ligase B
MNFSHRRMIKPMATPSKTVALVFRDLGRIRYAPAFDLQHQLHQQVLDGLAPPTILLLEHEPVITLSQRDSVRDHLLASPALLRQQGVELADTDRGGDITYHGPGQLVAYPILPLEPLGLNVRQYVRLLEQVVIDTLNAFGLPAHRDSCAVGVWVGGEPRTPVAPDASSSCDTRSRKIAAIGVRIRRWVSLHGLALNVAPRLDHFNLIVPCGLTGRPVTSMRQELGPACPDLPQVKSILIEQFQRLLHSDR